MEGTTKAVPAAFAAGSTACAVSAFAASSAAASVAAFSATNAFCVATNAGAASNDAADADSASNVNTLLI